MIRSFACRDTEALFNSRAVARFRNIERAARRKLLQIHASTALSALRIPPGNRLEALKEDRSGQYSIRINDQWRVCFIWRNQGAHDVEIVDYH
ncbi:type II toxin-antitoxin system RelE/ParE family toxin [Sinimarinibacterium flocculans]|uniref:type II toxin-antitoxin system RelE/ParE family toxin n=1 Tax=Sinimarinibacterium flocculans TaxID=985250 RepID=UPI0035170FF6